MNIEGLLVDYGGTIDTNGRHWAVVFFEQYHQYGVQVRKDDFYAAYVFAERKMALEPIIKPYFTFEEVLEVKIAAQMDFLQIGDLYATIGLAIVQSCCSLVKGCIEQAKPVLEALGQQYKLLIVSNFYGNIENVLDDYNLLGYFEGVVESARVGVRKPDPAIYQLGVEALNLPAKACAVIGDSYSKDIVPAKACGCSAIWLEKENWEEPQLVYTVEADHVIRSFDELRGLLL